MGNLILRQISLLFIPLILILAGMRVSMAQHAGYKLYTVADGLVQSEVTAIHQDKKGFLWIGTKSGISRFDGHSFQTLAEPGGVSKGWVQHIEDLNDSTVWFLTAKGAILYTYGQDAPAIKSYPVDNYGFTGHWILDGKGYFITLALEFFQVDQSGIKSLKNTFIDRIKGNFSDDGRTFLTYSKRDGNFYFRTKQGRLACFRNNKIIILSPRSFSLLSVGRDDRIYCLTPDQAFAKYYSYKPLKELSNSDILQKESSKLYLISDTVITRVADFGMDPEILENRLFIENEDTLFFSSPVSLILRQLIRKKLFSCGLPFAAVNDMLLDRERNLWLGSPLGLVKLYPFGFTNFNESDGLYKNIQMIAEDKNHHIIVGGFENGIQKIEEDRISNLSMPAMFNPPISHQIYPGCGKDRKGDLYISANPYCMITWDGKSLRNIDGLPVASSFCFFEDTVTQTWYCGTNAGLLTKNAASSGYRLLKISPGNKNNRVVSMVKDDSGRLFLGGFKGLSFMKGEEVTHLPSEAFPYAQGANAMAKDHRGNIWIGNNDGLWMFDTKKFLKIPNSWFNDLVVSLCVIDSSKLFIGGLHGIGFLDLHAFYKNDSAEIRYFNADNGFTGNECQQNAVCYDSRGILWVATTDNLQRIDPASLPPVGAAPKVYIEKISVLDETMKTNPHIISSVSKGRLDLDYHEHNIRFDFTAPVFRGPSFVKFRYRLEGQDNEWSQPTAERYVVYTNLDPGRYVFKVIACNDSGLWSVTPASFYIFIHPAFWQTWWFRVLTVMFLAAFFFLSGYLFMSRRKRSMQEKLESEKKIAELQLISIRNQIDPHFTFNAMNSIASVILKDEKEKAYSFFVKLSNLIRQVLTSGDKVTRSLAEELVFVQNYLEIEKLRFRDSFRFKIDVIQPVNLDQEVPKMVIQTYAENALKHGLLNKKDGTGDLIITIREEEKKLHITIEDNGVGREQAKLADQKSTGKGMMILNFYYDFFDRYNDQKILHEVTDLYNDRNEPAGTKVTVIIPSGFRYKITAHGQN